VAIVHVRLTCFALMVLLVGCGGSDDPTGPSATAVWQSVSPPFSLARNDRVRILFRVNAAEWSGAAPPDMLSVLKGSGQYDGNNSTGSGFRVELQDGARVLGTATETDPCPLFNFVASAPANCTETVADFASIQSGSIDGRVEFTYRGTSANVTGPFDLILIRRSDNRVIQTGVTVTGHEILR
jgi:hypothetical protein